MITCLCCPPEPTRRGVLWGASALAGTLALATPAEAQQRRTLTTIPVAANVQNEDLPLVDFHTHLQKAVQADDLIDFMNDTNVARLVLMPDRKSTRLNSSH